MAAIIALNWLPTALCEACSQCQSYRNEIYLDMDLTLTLFRYLRLYMLMSKYKLTPFEKLKHKKRSNIVN